MRKRAQSLVELSVIVATMAALSSAVAAIFASYISGTVAALSKTLV